MKTGEPMPGNATLVAYSRAHFDPDGNAALHRASSAGILAEAVHSAAVACSDHVLYVDSRDRSEWPNLDDVANLIAIESAFVDLVKRYTPKQSMLFAVNQEAYVSVEKWLAPISVGQLPPTAILGSYDLHSRDPRAVALADQILIVGDCVTYGTYLQRKSPDALHVVPYGYGTVDPSLYDKEPFILFPASSIGIRKGLDLVSSLCKRLAEREISRVRVVVMGSPSNRYWRRALESWQNCYPGTVIYPGWLSGSQEEYRRVMSSATCAVVPSREEGLVGMAVELLKARIPVFSTIECGLGPRHNRFVLREDQKERWADQIIDFCIEEDWDRLSAPLHHDTATSTDAVREAVKRFLRTGDVRPKFWVQTRQNVVVLSRAPGTGAIEYGSWINQNQTKPERRAFVDGVVLGAQYLDGRSDVNELRLREAHFEETFESVSIVGSVHPRALTCIGSDVEVHRDVCSVTVRSQELGQAPQSEGHRLQSFSAFLIRLYVLRIAWRARPLRRLAASVRQRLKRRSNWS